MNIAINIYFKNYTEHKIICLKKVPKKIRDIISIRMIANNGEILAFNFEEYKLISKAFVKFNFEKNNLNGILSIKVNY